ncbi:uncharacterized protein EDB91DRAFT_1085889 [Suillus paluster]|uniref:uncharacterized protein n=1 Tax=Suillus paluster TaxID=48578 RepID=UPI001B8634F6|nr:uncharacterized protein EDB91DRAFT_1085889 [Suillus paluster]KAG1728950.1 hypothetical protein EDB91DRAFT_1085889 [Suillus paluster]
MHFSFILAIVAALTTSISAASSADSESCLDILRACTGPYVPEGAKCCKGLASLASEWQHDEVLHRLSMPRQPETNVKRSRGSLTQRRWQAQLGASGGEADDGDRQGVGDDALTHAGGGGEPDDGHDNELITWRVQFAKFVCYRAFTAPTHRMVCITCMPPVAAQGLAQWIIVGPVYV